MKTYLAQATPTLPPAIDFQKLYSTLQNTYNITPQLPGGQELAQATLGDVISAFLPYVFVLAGLILFGYLIWGGFELLTSGGNPEKIKAAQGKIVNTLIGFIIIFTSYWLAQILEIIFGINIVG